MVLDKELHRKVLQEVLAKVNIPGEHARLFVELMTAVDTATVTSPDPHQRGHDLNTESA